MALIRDWRKEIHGMSDNMLTEYFNHINQIVKWHYFREEFEGIEAVRILLLDEIEERGLPTEL